MNKLLADADVQKLIGEISTTVREATCKLTVSLLPPGVMPAQTLHPQWVVDQLMTLIQTTAAQAVAITSLEAIVSALIYTPHERDNDESAQAFRGRVVQRLTEIRDKYAAELAERKKAQDTPRLVLPSKSPLKA